MRPVKNRRSLVEVVYQKNFPSPYLSIYTLDRTFSLEREEAQNGRENLSQNMGEPKPKMGESCSRFRFKFGGIKADRKFSISMAGVKVG